MRLTGIFNHSQIVLFCNSNNRLHISALAIEMDGQDGARARRDRGSDGDGIDQVVIKGAIDEHRLRASVGNGFGGGDEAVGNGDDLVAGADAEGPKDELEGIGAGADDDGVLGAAEFRPLALEGGDLRPEDELAVAQHSVERRIELGA